MSFGSCSGLIRVRQRRPRHANVCHIVQHAVVLHAMWRENRPFQAWPTLVVATSFAAAVAAPDHFRCSRAVGAYLGLTPRRRQSGESDHSAGVSKRGDKLLRSYLFEAAACLLIRVQRPSALKAWGVGLVQRLGFKRAAVAVARKLSVVLHAMWRENRPFQAWPTPAVAAAA